MRQTESTQSKQKQSGVPLQHLAFVTGIFLLTMSVGITFISILHLLIGPSGGNPGLNMTLKVMLLMLPGLAVPGIVFVVSFWMKNYPRLCRGVIALAAAGGFAWVIVTQILGYQKVFPLQYAQMVKQTGVLVADTAFWISVIGGTGMCVCIFALCVFCLVRLPVR